MTTKIDIIVNDLWNELDFMRDELKILLKTNNPLPEEFRRIKKLLLMFAEIKKEWINCLSCGVLGNVGEIHLVLKSPKLKNILQTGSNPVRIGKFGGKIW